MLFCRDDPRDTLELRGVRVVDPAAGVDGQFDLAIEDGVIVSLAPAEGTPGGLVVAPAFVDPHVHLRTPGREDEETLATGSAAAAAGGYCAIVTMPNTDPPVDSAPVLASLIERAREESRVPMGFMAGISKRLAGDELTEMAELAALGVVAFTDDGHPVASANLMRRALQYSAVADRPLALHCEEPDLSRDGQMHEGAVSAELGLAGWPSIAESVMIERDIALAAYESRPIHVMHISARESVEALARALAIGAAVSGEASPHHLCATDELVRSLSTNAKMNPPLRTEADREALVAAVRSGVISCIATDHAPHALHEKDVPFEEAPFGVTGLETAFAVIYTRLVAHRRAHARGRDRADVDRACARLRAARAEGRGWRDREPGGARSRGGVAGTGGRVRLAIDQLVARRSDAHRRDRQDDRRR